MARPARPDCKQRLAYDRAHCQARFRGEGWQWTYELWWRAWRDSWHLRGRGQLDLMMVRIDPDRPWGPQNYALVERGPWQSRRRLPDGTKIPSNEEN